MYMYIDVAIDIHMDMGTAIFIGVDIRVCMYTNVCIDAGYLH